MPLQDHFHPQPRWDALHGGWPMVMSQHLNRLLPPEYTAGPRIHLGCQMKIDVATLDRHGSAVAEETGNDRSGILQAGGGVAVAPMPTWATEAEMIDFDEYEVRIHQSSAQLVAAIELISPGNLNRPESRNQFVTKCASLLRQEVALVMVDVVTSRQSNLYAELLATLDRHDPALSDSAPPTYAAAIRYLPRGNVGRLETWYHQLCLGEELPSLPLWLTDDLAVPLDLEQTYTQTLEDLRMV